jgi:retron-type reverse transcriptase
LNLFQRIIAVPSLYQAWRKVRANRGAAGIDAVSLQAFETGLEANLRELSRSLLNRSYQPMPARYVTIAKANGKERELAILTVRDRVAQRATLDAIEPLFEPQFLDCNYAFRPGRSVEMAVQRMIAARANGYWWTVESDVQDFFCTIDRSLLLSELEETIHDQDMLRLLKMWLDAGALEQGSRQMKTGFWRQGYEAMANLRMLAHETLNQSLDDFVAQRLGLRGGETALEEVAGLRETQGSEATADDDLAGWQVSAQKQVRREGIKRLLQDGAVVALSQRALVRKLLSVKLLGIGGAAVAAALLAPKAVSAYRQYFHPRLGTLQGAPLSPLLTNAYMTPFDAELTQRGWRLIRYCDDFVIQCRTESEARAALQTAEKVLSGRKLKLHPLKTRLVPPGGELEFLGYIFAANGQVIPPPTVPEQVAKQIRAMARRALKWRKPA